MKNDGRPGYAGKIQNAGAQKVQAPFSTSGKKGKSTIKSGNDLRSSGGKK